MLDWRSGKAIYPEAFLQSILLAGLRHVPQANETRSLLPARHAGYELRLHAFPEQGG